MQGDKWEQNFNWKQTKNNENKNRRRNLGMKNTQLENLKMKNIVIEIKPKKIDEINSSLGKMKVEFLN